MSQKAAYYCDACEKIIGNKPHFSLAFNHHSGIALPPRTPFKVHGGGMTDRWSLTGGIAGKFLHFCSTKCLTPFFDNLLVKGAALAASSKKSA